MEKDLQQQQALLWEFYKTWVSNHTQLSGDSKENDMYQLYEQLNLLLTTEVNPSIHQTLTPTPVMKSIEKDFPSVVNFIADVVAPEKIFCLSHQVGTEGIDYADLLIVIPEVYPQTFPEIETVLDFACLKHHHLSCSLFKEAFFHRLIREGHIYYSLACDPESVVYDRGTNILPELKLVNYKEKVEKTNREFYKGISKAKTFYEAALNHQDSNLTMSAFMLHQAIELCLRALTKSLTGQDKTTHGLKTLLRFSLRFTAELYLIMSNKEAEDERLLEVLEKAYLGFRYSEKYEIEERDLQILLKRAKNLLECTEKVFVEWLTKYDLLISKAQSKELTSIDWI